MSIACRLRPVLLLALFFAAPCATAQNWTLGLFAGARQARVASDVSDAAAPDYAGAKAAYGPVMGFRASRRLGKGAYLRAELAYGLHGGRFAAENEFDSDNDSALAFMAVENLLQMHYLGLPVALEGRYDVSEWFRLQGFAGLEPAVLLSATSRLEREFVYRDGRIVEQKSPVENVTDGFAATDVAVLVGAAASFRLAPGGASWLGAELRYAGGLSDVDPENGRNTGSQRRRGLTLALSLSFDLP